MVPASRPFSSLGRPKRAADPWRPHEGAESRALWLGARGGAGALLSARLRVSCALRVSRVGVRVAACRDVLGVEDGGGEFSPFFVSWKSSFEETCDTGFMTIWLTVTFWQQHLNFRVISEAEFSIP